MSPTFPVRYLYDIIKLRLFRFKSMDAWMCSVVISSTASQKEESIKTRTEFARLMIDLPASSGLERKKGILKVCS